MLFFKRSAPSPGRDRRQCFLVVLALSLASCGGTPDNGGSADSERASSDNGATQTERSPTQPERSPDAAGACPLSVEDVSRVLGTEIEARQDDVAGTSSCAYTASESPAGELGVAVVAFPPQGAPYETLADAREALSAASGGDLQVVDKPDWGPDAFVLTETAPGHPVGQVSAFIPQYSITLNLPVAEYDVDSEGVRIADRLVQAMR